MEPPRQPHADYLMQADGMFWETSIKLARAQIARHIQNSSTMYRQRQSRVHKPMSTGNSPQNMCRRRAERACPHHYGFNISPSRRCAITAGISALPPQQRPITWHAPMMPLAEESAYHRHSTYEPPFQMVPFQANALQATMPQALESSMHQKQVDQHLSYHEQGYFGAEYPHVPISSDWFVDQPQTPYSASSNVSTMPLSGRTGSAYGAGHATRNNIDASTPPFSMKHHPQFSPVMLGQSSPSSRDALIADASDAQIETAEREDGFELVGLGLYDRPAQTSSFFDGAARHSPNNTGRGLKLEDAWTPPDEDCESSDDGYGEDEDQGDDDDEDSEEQDDDSDLEMACRAVPNVYSPGNHLPGLDLNNKPFLFVDKPEVVLGATALATLTAANWETAPQAWTS